MLRDDEEDEDHEEFGGGSQLLGFMFGNVDNSGDLDIDYLDEDAKEHLAALADKLGPSLADIDLIRSSPVPIDASEQDYDEKAEDAIDYEDIDEQYDGPEVQNTTEEDHLLPKGYFTSNTLLASLDNNPSVFDEENYDEDEENLKTTDVEDKLDVKKSGSEEDQLELTSAKELSLDDNLPNVPSEGEDMVSGPEEIQEEDVVEPERNNSTKAETSLPVLCVEDGMVILKFSEIFGMHESQKRPEKKDRSKCLIDRFRSGNVTDVEDDEEIVLRGSLQNLSIANNYSLTIDVVGNDMEHACDAGERMKDASLYAQPMKVDKFFENIYDEQSTLCPDIYPLIQQDWEDGIIWGNSPTASQDCLESCVASEYDCEDITYNDLSSGQRSGVANRKEIDLLSTSTLENSFPSRELSCSFQNRYSEKSSHPQIQGSDYFPIGSENENAEMCKSNASQLFNKPPSLNKDLLEGSWLDHIIWDSSEDVPKPKLILDLQDNQMLFEVLDQSISEDLRRHAGAMVISRSLHPSADDTVDPHNQGISSFGRFNISNDKYYSNRKVSQQAKSHAKKRALSSIKVFHAVPALKLETMKPKLSNKEIANFHRPKALWFPPCNEILTKVHGALRDVGPMKIILMSLGGKPIKFNVNAEESLSSVKLRASKKLDMKQSENARVFYFGRELNDGMSLAAQGIQPNSVLHVVRTMIHFWPRAQKLPGENKPLRPPGAFKKKSELSVKEGHVFLMEYCEERPLLLGNVGMGARLCTYYQKTAPSDQTASTLRNGNSGFGAVLALDPADKSPFLGDISSGCSQTCLETNMYRAPIFSHKLASTDFLLVRSAKGILSLRRIDKLYVVGQQEPHMEVFSPGTKNVQTYLVNRMLVYIYREFLMKEKPGLLPCIRNDELISQFPGLTEPFIRKRLKHCADPKKSSHGQLLWVKKSDFRIPSEEELRRMLAPENVCSYESMQAGLYRLKHLGISRLTHPIGLSTAMNQLPDEAIALAAASHIERELQITSWNLTSNFVACTNQDRENIERLEITGVGDPSGRGLGFSYVRVPTKAPISNATAKKKAAAAKGGTTVTGTDADLRRLSMDAAREVLLKFNVPEEQIDKLTRWHRIALVRKLSSEQAASGVTVEAPMLNKFARGQRMSFLQLQQQTREKCQEIWDRQVQNLSAIDGDENDSDSEPHSDLDSFAGDLENLLDAEEYDEEDDGNTELKGEKGEAVRGLKMRRCPSQAQAEEELEDNEVEAALIRRLLEGDSSDVKKKKKLKTVVTSGSHLVTQNAEAFKKSNNMLGQSIRMSHPDASFVSKDTSTGEPKEVERLHIERNLSLKLKPQKGNGAYDDMSTGVTRKKSVLAKDGTKVLKEKKPGEKPVREGFVCGACGQIGHMRTNKNCPKYGEEADTSELETLSGKPNVLDVTAVQMKTPSKKAPKLSVKTAELEVSENVGTVGLKTLGKVIPVKFKCGPAEKPFEKSLLGAQTSDKQIPDAQTDSKSSIKISRIIISNKKTEDTQHEVQKPSVVIRLPIDTEKDQPRKKIIIKHPKVTNSMERDRQTPDFEMDDESRKMKKIAELSSSGKHKMQESEWLTEEVNKRDSVYGKRLWDEEAKRRNKEMMSEDRSRRVFEDERRQEHQWRSFENIDGYEETIRKSELKKGKKKKKIKPDFKDEYLLEHRPSKNVRKNPERDRAVKKRTSIDSSQSDYAPSAKRRRGGEVELSNILENIVDSLRGADVSYLFRKPVTKKEAPDYFDVVKHPMDLSTIRDKVRNMDYRSREDFRHDIWQITYNAHTYNDKRNPHIPPLADQLLELCDYHLEERHEELSDAEEAIKF